MRYLFLIIAFTLYGVSGSTQSTTAIQRQADSLRSHYKSIGFEIVRETSLVMESEYEFPIVLPLTAGTHYQFIFIGEMSSRLYEVRLFDWNEKQVIFRQNRWGDIDGNIISFSYIPPFSEYHMFRPVQLNKKRKKDLGGYVMLFKKIS